VSSQGNVQAMYVYCNSALDVSSSIKWRTPAVSVSFCG